MSPFAIFLVEGATKVIENADPNHDRRSRSYMNAPSGKVSFSNPKEKDGIQNVVLENITVQNFTKNGVAIVSGKTFAFTNVISVIMEPV